MVASMQDIFFLIPLLRFFLCSQQARLDAALPPRPPLTLVAQSISLPLTWFYALYTPNLAAFHLSLPHKPFTRQTWLALPAHLPRLLHHHHPSFSTYWGYHPQVCHSCSPLSLPQTVFNFGFGFYQTIHFKSLQYYTVPPQFITCTLSSWHITLKKNQLSNCLRFLVLCCFAFLPSSHSLNHKLSVYNSQINACLLQVCLSLQIT